MPIACLAMENRGISCGLFEGGRWVGTTRRGATLAATIPLIPMSGQSMNSPHRRQVHGPPPPVLAAGIDVTRGSRLLGMNSATCLAYSHPAGRVCRRESSFDQRGDERVNGHGCEPVAVRPCAMTLAVVP